MVQKGITQWDLISITVEHKRNGIPLSNTFPYLKQNISYWPDDDRLRLKHVATL